MRKVLIKIVIALILSTLLLTFVGCATTNNDATPPTEGLIPTIKLSDKMQCETASIYSSAVTYLITPSGFDFEELNKRGYKMTITVAYEVHYVKNWDVLWDIGYLGAPKYEVYILDDDLVGKANENIFAPLSKTNRTIAYTIDVINLIGSKIFLTFSSNNIQNIIYFTKINVSYSCHK